MSLDSATPTQLDPSQPSSSSSSSSSLPPSKELEKLDSSDPDFRAKVSQAFSIGTGPGRKPVILKGVQIGPCVDKWTCAYLIDSCVEKKVKVHKSLEKALDFRRKNFVYDTISFRELIQLCSGQKEEGAQAQGLIDEDKYRYYWYLRSLGDDPRGKDVSDLSVHFPQLAKDLEVPDLFPKESFFSSVFRITSAGLQLWTHYDTCDNILIQIKGRKRILFYPPTEALNLYLDGDKSEIVDVDKPDLERYPKFKDIERFEVVLEQGDIVFIPALWFHNVTALEYSISVNVFWKNLEPQLYDKKDPYGNKDLIPAQLGYKTLDKIISQLGVLPLEYQDFYIRRMITRLDKRLGDLAIEKREQELSNSSED